jgi:hypothetical protein
MHLLNISVTGIVDACNEGTFQDTVCEVEFSVTSIAIGKAKCPRSPFIVCLIRRSIPLSEYAFATVR